MELSGESSMELSPPGTNVLQNFRSRERKFQGWNFRSRERKFLSTTVDVVEVILYPRSLINKQTANKPVKCSRPACGVCPYATARFTSPSCGITAYTAGRPATFYRFAISQFANYQTPSSAQMCGQRTNQLK